MEVWFVNDFWEGEGQTGDSNLDIACVQVNGVYYGPNWFHLQTEGAGSHTDYGYRLWRNGAIRIDLAAPPDCIVQQLSGIEQPSETKNLPVSKP